MARHKQKPEKPVHFQTLIKKDYTQYWLITGLLLTLIVYFPCLFNGITNWDDTNYLNNPYVKDLSPAGIVKIFSIYFAGNYHPLTLLSIGIDRLIGGGNPFIFHFTNLLLHLFNTFLVFLLVKRLTQNNLLAILTFMLFGVHTLHVESVAWVSERKDVLYSFFFLLSLIFYTKYVSGRRVVYYGLSLLLFLLSLLSKGQGVVLVAILPLIDYMKERKWFSIKVLSEKIPFLLLLGIFGCVAFLAQDSVKAFYSEYFPLHERFAFASFGLTQYLIKSIIPIGLSAIYPYPPSLLHGNIPSFYWLFIIPLPVYVIGSYFLFKRSKIYAFGLSMFFLNLLPVLQIIPFGGAIMADRYFYMPSVGLLLCFALGLLEIRNTRIRYPIFMLFILILSTLSFSRCMVWKDSITLWDDVISRYNYSPIAYSNLGNAHANLGRWDKAIADFSRALDIDPKDRDTYYNRGIAYSTLRQWNKAIEDYSKVIEIDPKYANAYSNRGVVYGNLGQLYKAIADYSSVIEIDPKFVKAYYNRGIVYYNLRQWNKAIADYTVVIGIDPVFSNAYFNLGNVYSNLGQQDNAIALYTKAIEINPKNSDAYSNRGVAYSNVGQEDKAIADYSRAIEIDPKSAVVYYNLGLAYYNLKQFDKAIADFSRAIEINPKYVKAHFNRGVAYGDLGQWSKAIADYSRAIEIDPDYTAAYSNRDFSYRKLQSKKR
ncbi:MAG: tetratricopeptide repeat protein [Bacteroidetes bacterium]|nr:tetratricopeptide repeat protein [Bacteroidota bacterium]